MTKQEEIREGIAKRKLEIVIRCETRLIHSLSSKVQKQLGHEPYTWETIPEYLKVFWLEEADKEMNELDSQGVVIKVDIPDGWLLAKPTGEGVDQFWVQVGSPKIVAVEPLIEEIE